jgi:hypothetical protein
MLATISSGPNVGMKDYLARIDVESAGLLPKKHCVCGNYRCWRLINFIFMHPRAPQELVP